MIPGQSLFCVIITKCLLTQVALTACNFPHDKKKKKKKSSTEVKLNHTRIFILLILRFMRVNLRHYNLHWFLMYRSTNDKISLVPRATQTTKFHQWEMNVKKGSSSNNSSAKKHVHLEKCAPLSFLIPILTICYCWGLSFNSERFKE